MSSLHPWPAALRPSSNPLVLHAREAQSPWEAKGFADLVPPATLVEARAHRDDLARLLRSERAAAADFLLTLADFDRRRGWERLGHASLFAFLTRELGLSNSAAWYRQAAARLIPRFPAVEAALREGRLCLSVVGDLSRVLTPENETEVLPRFLGASSRDAKVVAASILPCPSPPWRDVVTVVRAPERLVAAGVAAACGAASIPSGAAPASRQGLPTMTAPAPAQPAALDAAAPPGSHAARLLAPEVAPTRPARGGRDEVVPLTSELRRLSITVSAGFLDKLAAARDGLSHAKPRATTEQVLEAALDLLLEKQARAKGLVKQPRRASATSKPPSRSPSDSSHPPGSPSESIRAAPHHPRHVPAAIEREVRLRDGHQCQHPLDDGGVCGSTWQVELDHIVPKAQEGPTTIANLRCACAFHNRYAAERALGSAVMEATRGRSPR